MDTVMAIVLAALMVYGAYALYRNTRSWLGRRRGAAPTPAARGVTATPAPATARVREDAKALRNELGDWPVDRYELDESAGFGPAVERLRAESLPLDELVALARDGDRWVSRIALGALVGRSDLPRDWSSYVVRRLRQAPYDQASLFLETLRTVPEPVIGPVLSQLEHVHHRDVAELIAARLASGIETVDAETFRREVPLRHAELIEALLDETESLIPELREPFETWRAGAIDDELLAQFARTWERPYDDPPALLVGSRPEIVDAIEERIAGGPSGSLLLVGEHGVGKTALVRAALDRLPPHWLAFEATASAVNAGAIYVGELEGRVQQIVDRLRGRAAVWVLPSLEEALWAGRHSQSPTSLLDHLLPHVQSGDLRIVAEITPAALELVLAQRPQVASAFETLRVRPLGEADTIAVARHVLETDDLDVTAADDVLAESLELAHQFLPGAAAPGNLVRLLSSTAEDVAERGDVGIETRDVLATIARVTGLPLALLDPSAALELDRVRAFFESRILGQRDAVECLVERIALVKAGMTDPTRPLGVFLFVGPTGTGKTEIAKALAEFLFGSPNRLVRLDMTEFQTPESLERLLSDTSLEPQGAPLVAAVRKEPFAVVLLDEFEKAAQPIWDVFLQVFDDGRLTDRHGRVVDFRRCVIVLTSNVGSSIASGPGLGFDRTADPFSAEGVERAVTRSFRPEFLNRLDRVVVFRPLGRDQMRALLDLELESATARRGLRGRPWAIEYDESALEFLIDQGFSPHLGARPLKRAVEQHFLAPLATAIVDRTVPEGDQFLFVTALNGKIEVRFVDPDLDEAAPADGEESRERDLDLRSAVLTPRPDPALAVFLLDELQRIRAAVEGDAVQGRKERGLTALTRPGFWDDDGRFGVLADIEYLDRLEAALTTAEKLGRRLQAQSGRTGQTSGEIVGLLATRLYVLDAAISGLGDGAAHEVLLRLHPVGQDDDEARAFVDVLAGMYGAWAERRGMRMEPVPGKETAFGVSGLGAGAILALERGLHVLEVVGEETREGDRPVDRIAVAVDVVAVDPSGSEAEPGAAPADIVRRYRPGASPLVRDAARGYRTGRLDRILAGDFDLF